MTSKWTAIVGADSGYAALFTKVNTLAAYRHTLDDAVKTASYSATATDQLAYLNSASGALTVSLPAVASSANVRLFFFVLDATNAIVLDPNASETINGRTTLALTSKYQFLEIFCDGSAWYTPNIGQAQEVRSWISKTANYTLTLDDGCVKASAAGGGFTLTLPTAASAKGRTFRIIATSVAGGNVTVAGNGAELINGANTKVLSVQYSALCLISDGTQWWAM